GRPSTMLSGSPPLSAESKGAGSKLLTLVLMLLPFLIGIGVIPLRLPPWAEQMSYTWGPTFLLLAGLAAGFVHYVPRTAVSDFLIAQKEQAIAMTAISLSLQQISGQAGKLDALTEKVDTSLINQRVMLRKLDAIEKRHVPEA